MSPHFHHRRTGHYAVNQREAYRGDATLNGYQKNRAIEIIETLIELIKSRKASGEDVMISGFGKFCVKKSMNVRAELPRQARI